MHRLGGVLSPVSLGRDRACPVFFHASFWPSGVEVLRAQGNGHTFSLLSGPIKSPPSTGYCKAHPYSVSGKCAAHSAFLNGALRADPHPSCAVEDSRSPLALTVRLRLSYCTRLPKRNRGVLLPSGLSSTCPGIPEKIDGLVLDTTESIYNPSRDLHAPTETDERPSLARLMGEEQMTRQCHCIATPDRSENQRSTHGCAATWPCGCSERWPKGGPQDHANRICGVWRYLRYNRCR